MDITQRIPRREWLFAVGLLVLALIPAIAGSLRVGEIVTGAPPTPQNARFLDVPTPIVLHIVGAIVYSFVRVFQFLPTFRRRHRTWHRFAGRYLLVPTGVLVAGTGIWMNLIYDMPPSDGLALEISRYIVGVLMLLFLGLGVMAIARRNVHAHGAWMIRAYALGMGAGTQVRTSGPALLIFGEPDVLMRVIQMDAGWIINAAVAEWVIARMRAKACPKPATITV